MPSYYQRPKNREIIRDLETALERIEQLEADAGLHFQTHPSFGFTTAEEVILGLLCAAHQTLTRERIFNVMYGMHDNPPEPKIIDVQMSHIRSKLRAHDFDPKLIRTVWGRGYFIEPEDRRRLEAMIVLRAETEAA